MQILLAVTSLLAATIVGVALATGTVTPRLMFAYGVLGLLGFLGQLIADIGLRLFPTLLWAHAWHGDAETRTPPANHVRIEVAGLPQDLAPHTMRVRIFCLMRYPDPALADLAAAGQAHLTIAGGPAAPWPTRVEDLEGLCCGQTELDEHGSGRVVLPGPGRFAAVPCVDWESTGLLIEAAVPIGRR